MRSFQLFLVALTASAINQAVAAGPEDFFGMWKQDFERSAGFHPAGVTSATMRIEKAGEDSVKLTLEEMDSGKKIADDRVFKLDGSPFTTKGSLGAAYQYRRVSPTVWVWSSKNQARETNGLLVLSKDGKSLYMTAEQKLQNGQQRHFIRVFEKQ